MGVGAGHAFITTLSCFHPGHFYVFISLIVTRACQVVVIHHIGIKMISISRLRLYNTLLTKLWGCIGGVVVNVIASSAVDDGFEPRSGQTKDYEIGISCFSAKHTAL